MTQPAALVEDPSTPSQKFFTALTGFGFACTAFFLTLLVAVPLTGWVAQYFSIPAGIALAVILAEMIGFTVAAGIYGVSIVARAIRQEAVASSGV